MIVSAAVLIARWHFQQWVLMMKNSLTEGRSALGAGGRRRLGWRFLFLGMEYLGYWALAIAVEAVLEDEGHVSEASSSTCPLRI